MRTLSSLPAILVVPLLAISLSGCATRAGSESGALAPTASAQGVELLRLAEADQQTRPASPGGAQEGVKVHGHWTIEVRDPDGTVVTHREFENSLQTGARTLGPALGRASTVGLWYVGIYFPGAVGPCLGPSATSVGCFLIESATTLVLTPWVIPTLTVSAPLFPLPNAGTLTLSGTFTVQLAGRIFSVTTGVGGCAPTVAPASCTSSLLDTAPGPGSSFFSGTVLATPINVTVGQLVQVTVVFSFS